MANNYVDNVYAMLRRRGLSAKYEHPGIYCIRLDGYRKFIRQLRKIEPIDQLSAINYMLFSYTENIFLHPSTYENVRKNRDFMEVCRRTTVAETPLIFENHIQTAIEEFSFSKRNTIPNLLSKEYALKQV